MNNVINAEERVKEIQEEERIKAEEEAFKQESIKENAFKNANESINKAKLQKEQADNSAKNDAEEKEKAINIAIKYDSNEAKETYDKAIDDLYPEYKTNVILDSDPKNLEKNKELCSSILANGKMVNEKYGIPSQFPYLTGIRVNLENLIPKTATTVTNTATKKPDAINKPIPTATGVTNGSVGGNKNKNNITRKKVKKQN